MEKAMASHYNTLAWKIPWIEEPGSSPWGRKESDTTEWLPFHFSLSCIGEGHGNPLQCSCLENPRDGGAWWAAVCGVAQSPTRLKRLSSSSSRLTITSQYSCQKNPMDRRTCWATVHRVAKSQTWLGTTWIYYIMAFLPFHGFLMVRFFFIQFYSVFRNYD